MWDKDAKYGRGQESIMMRDLDGSLTNRTNVTVVKKGAQYSRGLGCVEKTGWNLQVCSERFLKV